MELYHQTSTNVIILFPEGPYEDDLALDAVIEGCTLSSLEAAVQPV